MLAMHVLSCTSLSQVCSHVSHNLSLALQTVFFTPLFHHFFTLKGSSTFGSFLRHTIITATCPPFTRKGMATFTNRPLHMHYCTTLWTCLSQTHRPYRLHCQPQAAVDTDQQILAQLSRTQQRRTSDGGRWKNKPQDHVQSPYNACTQVCLKHGKLHVGQNGRHQRSSFLTRKNASFKSMYASHLYH